jgi:fluoroquinolone transport system permease protein
MKALRVVQALGPIDAKGVLRDSLLRWLVLYPVLLALLLRWGVPALADRLADRYRFDLTAYYVLVMSFLVELLPILTGMVVGFLLLDQRDDHTLMAWQVTPLTLAQIIQTGTNKEAPGCV